MSRKLTYDEKLVVNRKLLRTVPYTFVKYIFYISLMYYMGCNQYMLAVYIFNNFVWYWILMDMYTLYKVYTAKAVDIEVTDKCCIQKLRQFTLICKLSGDRSCAVQTNKKTYEKVNTGQTIPVLSVPKRRYLLYEEK